MPVPGMLVVTRVFPSAPRPIRAPFTPMLAPIPPLLAVTLIPAPRLSVYEV